MSDNFCVFNEVIEDCTDEELDWLSDTELLLYEGQPWPDWARATISEDPEDLLYPMVHVDRTRRRVTIFSDDNVSPMAVVPLVQGFLRRFRQSESFSLSLSWASGSAKPGPGELGGGALVITADPPRVPLPPRPATRPRLRDEGEGAPTSSSSPTARTTSTPRRCRARTS